MPIADDHDGAGGDGRRSRPHASATAIAASRSARRQRRPARRPLATPAAVAPGSRRRAIQRMPPASRAARRSRRRRSARRRPLARRARRRSTVPSSCRRHGAGRGGLRLDLARRARPRRVVVAVRRGRARLRLDDVHGTCARGVASSSSDVAALRREVRHLDGRGRVAELELDALQGAGELDRGRVAVVAAHRHALREHRGEAARHVGAVDRRDRAALDAADEVERAVRPAGDLERRAAGEQRVHGRREREHVAALVGPGVVLEHLGRRPRHAHARPPTAPTTVADASAGAVTVCTGSSPSRFEEMPKSVSAGHP